jgi:hypothetical protein
MPYVDVFPHRKGANLGSSVGDVAPDSSPTDSQLVSHWDDDEVWLDEEFIISHDGAGEVDDADEVAGAKSTDDSSSGGAKIKSAAIKFIIATCGFFSAIGALVV